MLDPSRLEVLLEEGNIPLHCPESPPLHAPMLLSAYICSDLQPQQGGAGILAWCCSLSRCVCSTDSTAAQDLAAQLSTSLLLTKNHHTPSPDLGHGAPFPCTIFSCKIKTYKILFTLQSDYLQQMLILGPKISD